MPTVSETAALIAFRARCGLDGVSLTYTAGAVEIELTGLRGSTKFASEKRGQAIIEETDSDWHVAAVDLVSVVGETTTKITPARGNTIEETDGDGNTITYEVFPLPDEKCHRNINGILRIHTKRVATPE